MRRIKEQQRGFALLTVVLMVALMTMVLLIVGDVVSVDFSLLGEHRKNIRAENNAEAAMREVLGNRDAQDNLPDFSDANLRFDFVSCAGATCTSNSGVPAILDENNSSIVNDDDTYRADARFIRRGPQMDTSLGAEILVYEVSAVATVAGGDASSQVRSEVFVYSEREPGRIIPTIHAR